jgi:hypothetical protein
MKLAIINNNLKTKDFEKTVTVPIRKLKRGDLRNLVNC